MGRAELKTEPQTDRRNKQDERSTNRITLSRRSRSTTEIRTEIRIRKDPANPVLSGTKVAQTHKQI